jgi:hypothetical protein
MAASLTNQSLDVIYDKDITRCLLCHCVEESCGAMAEMSECKHTYHISCLIDYACVNAMKCPECNNKFYDLRLSLAVAYKREDTQSFINILGDV